MAVHVDEERHELCVRGRRRPAQCDGTRKPFDDKGHDCPFKIPGG
eukprot:gene47579-47443_t